MRILHAVYPEVRQALWCAPLPLLPISTLEFTPLLSPHLCRFSPTPTSVALYTGHHKMTGL
jgi:hypothetical protein